MGNSNYKTASNGIGLTMNLVDDASNITNILLIMGTCSGTTNFYATYQHAKNSNITMAISKTYTFGPTGLGSVLVFNNSTYRSYYDAMQGVSFTYYC